MAEPAYPRSLPDREDGRNWPAQGQWPVQPDLVVFRSGNEPRWDDENFKGIPDLVVGGPFAQHQEPRLPDQV